MTRAKSARRMLLKYQSAKRASDMKIGWVLHGRLPRAELVAVRGATIDPKKIATPFLASSRHSSVQRSERNANDRVGGVGCLSHGGKKICALPAGIGAHRCPRSIGRIDPRVEGGAERIDFDFVVARGRRRREKNLHDVFVVQGCVVTEMRCDDAVILRQKKNVEEFVVREYDHICEKPWRSAIRRPPQRNTLAPRRRRPRVFDRKCRAADE